MQRDAARRPRQQTAPLPNPYTSSQRTLRAAAERGTRAARAIRKPATRKIGKGLGPNFSRPAADAGENEQPTDSSADEQPTAPAGWMPAGPRSTVAQAERPEHWSGTTGGYYRDGRPQVVASAKPDAEVMAAAEAQGTLPQPGFQERVQGRLQAQCILARAAAAPDRRRQRRQHVA